MSLFDLFKTKKTKRKRTSFSGSNSAKENDAFYDQNDDILDGMQFFATLQLRVPLKVLQHHGEVFRGPPSKAPDYGDMSEGIWVPNLKSLDEEENNIFASDIGQVKDSEYLPFLIHFRKIVESNATSDEKQKAFLKMKDIPEFYKFWITHQKNGNIFYMRYVYGNLNDIPGVRAQTLFEMGYRNSEELKDKPDSFWLDMKGIGKVKLNKINKYFTS